MNSITSFFDDASVVAVLGGQYGDEGKGRIVVALAEVANIVARCNGGNNAGHTIVHNGVTYKFHLIPSGLVIPSCIGVIGNGVLFNVEDFFKEMEKLEEQGLKIRNRLFIDHRAHIVFGWHKVIDAANEDRANAVRPGSSIGTTRRGIGPAASSKYARTGLRLCDLIAAGRDEKDLAHFTQVYTQALDAARIAYPELANYDAEGELETLVNLSRKFASNVTDTGDFLDMSLKMGTRVLVEGANATMIDPDHGDYPFCTSTTTTIGAICSGLGINPFKYGVKTIMAAKPYVTRVGNGSFPTLDTSEDGARMARRGHEFGTTTNRPRDCGWFDAVAMRHAQRVNGGDAVFLSKLDVLSGFPELKIGVSYTLDGDPRRDYPARSLELDRVKVEYETLPGWSEDITGVRRWEDLPANARAFVERIEALIGCPIRYIGVGPETSALLVRG